MASSKSDRAGTRARLAVTIGDISIDLDGDEAVVRSTIEELSPILDHLVAAAEQESPNGDLPGLALTAAADEGKAPVASAESEFESWYGNRVVLPEGKRGFLQDHALLFIYYFTQVRRRSSASTRDVRWAFETLDIKEPNVPVLMHTLKGKRMVEPSEAYASYHLTPGGRDYVEDRFGLIRRG